MKNNPANTIIAAVGILVMSAQPSAADAAPMATQIAICIYNHANVPSETLAAAMQLGRRIFNRAGVKTVWGESSTEQAGPACFGPAPRMYVKIVGRETAEAFHLGSNILGVAPGEIAQPNRTTVYVFNHIADLLVHKQSIAQKSSILGYAMAHEIGHILAGMDKHSHFGIMQANWSEEDFRAMLAGGLNFDAEQAMRIRQEVERRAAASAV